MKTKFNNEPREIRNTIIIEDSLSNLVKDMQRVMLGEWERINQDQDEVRNTIKMLVYPELRTPEFEERIGKYYLTEWLNARMWRLASPAQRSEYLELSSYEDKWAWVCKQATHWYL